MSATLALGSSRTTPLFFGVLLIILSGCAAWLPRGAYQVKIPTLAAPPRAYACQLNDQPATCVSVTQRDWRALVIELKSACLALGGSREDCQTEERE